MSEIFTYDLPIAQARVFGVIVCRACGHVWLAHAPVVLLDGLECPACQVPRSWPLDVFATLRDYLRAYTRFPLLTSRH